MASPWIAPARDSTVFHKKKPWSTSVVVLERSPDKSLRYFGDVTIMLVMVTFEGARLVIRPVKSTCGIEAEASFKATKL